MSGDDTIEQRYRFRTFTENITSLIQCFYKWRQKYSGMESSDVKPLKGLEEESCRLKRMYADLNFKSHDMKKLKKAVISLSDRKVCAQKLWADDDVSITMSYNIAGVVATAFECKF